MAKFKQGLMASDEKGGKKSWMSSMSKLVVENKTSRKKKEQLMRYLTHWKRRKQLKEEEEGFVKEKQDRADKKATEVEAELINVMMDNTQA